MYVNLDVTVKLFYDIFIEHKVSFVFQYIRYIL